MEIILNASWLIVSFASYIFLVWELVNRAQERGRGLDRIRSIVALSCVLAILFPVISLSDDLQEMQAAVAEVPPSQGLIKKLGIDNPSTPGKQPHQVSFIDSSFISGVDLVSLRGIVARLTVDSVPGLQLITPCRAPPSSDALKITSQTFERVSLI